jgi:amino acid transporter
LQLSLRKLLFGSPLHIDRAAHERLPIILALPIFASDALSSVAYATEAILVQFHDYHLSQDWFRVALPISIGIIALILMVVISYWQVIFAYPGGGGSYVVAKENLGLTMGLIAASSLLVDYILTVAVSVSDGVGQAGSALINAGSFFNSLRPHAVLFCVLIVLVIMWANLRGVRESGALFAGPSYGFIALIFVMLAFGLYRAFAAGTPLENVAVPTDPTAVKGLDIGILLRGFASGCAALTGIEAVSNGVQAFKKPEAKNAATTLGILGVILAVMFIGITFLAAHFHIGPKEGVETVVSQIARASFGTKMPLGILYYAVQTATVLILLLAANTAFSGFPRLASILAEDGFLPRQLAAMGDRLSYNNGIILLALAAILFIIMFKGLSQALLPLYTVGVFIAFTSAQAGMVRRSWNMPRKPWAGLFINGLGAVLTLVVLGIVVRGKFWVERPLFGIQWLHEGAWMSLGLMGAIYAMFRGIYTHYKHVNDQLRDIPPDAHKTFKHTVIVLVPSRIHRGIIAALNYACSISPDAVAVHIGFDREKVANLRAQWEEHAGDTPLIILDSPYRTLVEPLMDYLDAADKVRDDDIITVILPEFVPARWWHAFLHNAHGWMLRLRLFYRRDIVITSVRYYLDR